MDYSGHVAAWAYKYIDPKKYNRVFLFGPSHNAYVGGCAISKCLRYETPLGDLVIDRDLAVNNLYQNEDFIFMSKNVDE